MLPPTAIVHLSDASTNRNCALVAHALVRAASRLISTPGRDMRSLLMALLLLHPLTAQTAEELNFTSAIGELRDMRQQLPAWLRSEAAKYLANRPRIGNEAAVK